MKYEKEHKVSHKEWVEVTIPADEFLANIELFKTKFGFDDDDGEDGYFDHDPTLNFENGTIWADESWGVNKDKRVWSSSFQTGVMSWDEKKQSYIGHRHFHETDLGQFVSATFTMTDEIEAILLALKA